GSCPLNSADVVVLPLRVVRAVTGDRPHEVFAEARAVSRHPMTRLEYGSELVDHRDRVAHLPRFLTGVLLNVLFSDLVWRGYSGKAPEFVPSDCDEVVIAELIEEKAVFACSDHPHL